MKKTKQRKIILDIINESFNHMTAYQIYEEARKIFPDISLGTIYRNLRLLSDNNLIKVIEVDKVSHYDKIVSHQHFICNNCRRIIDVYNLDLNINTYDNNKITDYEIILRGICEKCQKEE